MYDHADYVLTKNENFKNICFKVKSFNNRAVLVERDDPGFELTANDASGGSEPGLTIICSNGLSFEGSVEGKDDLIKEFHTYLADKQKKPSKEKDKYSLIKIHTSRFLYSEIEDWEGVNHGIPTQKATDYCIVRLKAFIDELKEKVDGMIGEKILISFNSKDFHALSELKNTVKQKYNFDNLAIYILLTKEISGKQLNSIFLSMSDYTFDTSYITATDSTDLAHYLVNNIFGDTASPHANASKTTRSIVNYAEKKKKKLNELNIDELKKIEPKLTIEILKKFKGEIVTQIYDQGEYDTGYFAATVGNWDLDAEQYVGKENDSPSNMSLEEYNKVMKMLLE